jgi:acyl-CoA reductase-like NAD-dependent aldehyde dehydrogenase
VENAVAERLVVDPRLPVVSFTGSGPVGAAIQAAAPHKEITLELGGNAAAIVCRDWNGDEELTTAARRIAAFGTYQGGQSCISVQRVFVDTTVHDRFVDLLVKEVRQLRCGDPRDPATHVGPLVNEAAAQRVEQWVAEAVAAGAEVLVGGTCEGATFAPTVLASVPRTCRVVSDEVFGPVLVVERVADIDAAFTAVDDSRFGLQVGVFTHDVRIAFRALRELEVGGVVVGDVPSFRAEQMPYGGFKESGTGREGVRYAMDDLTTTRVLVFSES